LATDKETHFYFESAYRRSGLVCRKSILLRDYSAYGRVTITHLRPLQRVTRIHDVTI